MSDHDDNHDSSNAQHDTPSESPDEAQPERTLDEVFRAWFENFNNDSSVASVQHRPAPGWLSFREVDKRLVGCGMTGEAIVELINMCRCRTRHMHAHPTALPPGWLGDPGYVYERPEFRVRRSSDPDNPQHWFAVEINEQDLDESLRLLDRETDPAAGPPAPQEPAAGDARQDHTALPPMRSANCPDGYGLVTTPVGVVAVWYGTPRKTEAEALADAYRHSQRAW